MTGIEWFRIATALLHKGYRLSEVMQMDDDEMKGRAGLAPLPLRYKLREKR